MAVPLRLRLFTTLKFEKPIYALATGDVDGDGKEEIVIGSDDGTIRIYQYEKGFAFDEIWNSAKYFQWVDHILIADIDDDTINEIFLVIGRHLVIYKYKDESFSLVWDFKSEARITSIFVGDSNNNHRNELLIGLGDGTLLIFASRDDDPFNFKRVWKKTKFEGDVLVSVGDVDANGLNELVVVSNNTVRVFRVVDKYPKRESWAEMFKNHIKELLLYDLNSDRKEQIFFGTEDGRVLAFSHKDGNYFSLDETYPFKKVVSTISSGTMQNKNIIMFGSFDQTVQAFKADSTKFFQIELEDKIYCSAIADIIHDGTAEILVACGKNIYIFKEDVILAIQMDYPKSILADEEITINYFIKNNTPNRVYNVDFSNLEWTPHVIVLKGPKPRVPIIEKNGEAQISFQFTPGEVQRATSITFSGYKLNFEMNNQQLSQPISESTIELLPKFSYIARHILARLVRLRGTKIPLRSLIKLMGKELGYLEYDIDQIVSRLLDEKFIQGSLVNRVLYVRDVNPYPEEEIIPTAPEQEITKPFLSPEQLLNALKKAVKETRRSTISELTTRFNISIEEINKFLRKLKGNFEITGILIPNEEFIYISPEEIDLIVGVINTTPNILISELTEQFGLSDHELTILLDELLELGKLYGQLVIKDGISRFITINALSESLVATLAKKGKMVIIPYSRKTGVSVETIREALRSLIDQNKISGCYTFNGAIFYTDAALKNALIESIGERSETTSFGLSSLAQEFQISKETIMLVLTDLINKSRINGYISENTLYIKSHEEEKLRDIFEKYIDALNVAHIIVIHRESGVAIFSEAYTPERRDSTLISGFLHAITSFGSEISGIEGHLRLLEYKDFKISVQDGELIRAALILKDDPSQRLLENLKHFVRFFDINYRDDLQHFMGAIDPFKDAAALVDDYFEVSLSFSYEIDEKKVFINRDRLSANDLVVINMGRSHGRQFILNKLLEQCSKELLISQLEAFSIIYNLRGKNIFIVIHEERKWCPHCGSIISKASTECPHCLRNIEDTLS